MLSFLIIWNPEKFIISKYEILVIQRDLEIFTARIKETFIMKKRTICIINCFLLVFIFLCVYGNICYRAAFEGKGGADFPQRIVVCVYFAILIILSIFNLCNHPCYSNKLLLFTGIFSAILTINLIIIFMVSLIVPGMLQLSTLDFFDWVIIIFPPIISSLYFFAAFKKK